MSEDKLYEKGLENFSSTGIIIGNALMLILIALGAIACSYFSPILMYSYLAFSIIMVFLVLRKLVCTNCYYYGKKCAIGWGKLSAVFFKKGDINKFSSNKGIKIAPIVYGIISFVPIVLIIIAIILDFSITKLIVLVLLLALSAYSGSIGRKKSCIKCKMRLICPGCAVKEK